MRSPSSRRASSMTKWDLELPTDHTPSILATIASSLRSVCKVGIEDVPRALRAVSVVPPATSIPSGVFEHVIAGNRHDGARRVQRLLVKRSVIGSTQTGDAVTCHVLTRSVARRLWDARKPPFENQRNIEPGVTFGVARWFHAEGKGRRNKDDVGAAARYRTCLAVLDEAKAELGVEQAVQRCESFVGEAREVYRLPTDRELADIVRAMGWVGDGQQRWRRSGGATRGQTGLGTAARQCGGCCWAKPSSSSSIGGDAFERARSLLDDAGATHQEVIETRHRLWPEPTAGQWLSMAASHAGRGTMCYYQAVLLGDPPALRAADLGAALQHVRESLSIRRDLGAHESDVTKSLGLVVKVALARLTDGGDGPGGDIEGWAREQADRAGTAAERFRGHKYNEGAPAADAVTTPVQAYRDARSSAFDARVADRDGPRNFRALAVVAMEWMAVAEACGQHGVALSKVLADLFDPPTAELAGLLTA